MKLFFKDLKSDTFTPAIAAVHPNMYACKRKTAFTLAEVLITLGIIGIVAAMTLPALIQKQQEKIAVNQLKKVYSVFSQAFEMAVLDHEAPEYWDIETRDSAGGAQKLYNIFKPYLQKVQDCGREHGCFSGHYKALNAPNFAWQPSTHSRYARGILADGTMFLFWSGGTGCNWNASKSNSRPLSRSCGAVMVDINGNKNPNQAGVDYFEFSITNYGIIPSGTEDYKPDYGNICKYNSGSASNGLICTAWAIYKENMDYRRKEIAW